MCWTVLNARETAVYNIDLITACWGLQSLQRQQQKIIKQYKGCHKEPT